jgi:hypothetical protein
METNEQTRNEQLIKETKESLILIGIANNILKMHFPKMQNLKDMLSFFDYEVSISPKLFESENSVVAFFQNHRDFKSVATQHDIEVAQKNSSYDKISDVFAGILKKIALCENTINIYLMPDDSNEFSSKKLVDFDKYHDRYFRIITILSGMENVLTPNLPIFKYDDKTYSIGEQKFKDEFELYEFFCKFHLDVFFVYQFKIYNDNSIILRYCHKK